MASAQVTLRLQGSMASAVAHGHLGRLRQEMVERGNRVRNAAVRLAPRDTGALAGSITMEVVSGPEGPVVRVGSNLPYARFVHDGTGIYGPRGVPIRPVRARMLAWPVVNNRYRQTGGSRRYKGGRTQRYAFAKQVRGVPPRPFLRDALKAAGVVIR